MRRSVYEEALLIREPERHLFLAIPEHIYTSEIEDELLIQNIIKHKHLTILIVNIFKKNVVKWIK
ncbi:MAG TPA: hypothetical protein ENJ95_12325 [Bacteroidetes bacterium]|nr:hypothetical protein [Bacteroidota bacterium]